MNQTNKTLAQKLLKTNRYRVEGMDFSNVACVLRYARENGYTGSETTIVRRLAQNGMTLAKLIAAPRSHATELTHARHSTSRDECALAMARMDARRAAINNTRPQEEEE